MVRGKFTVTEVISYAWSKDGRRIKLTAEYDNTIEEDKKYAQATPSANLEMFVDNPSAVKYLELGKKFYVDFTRVE